MRTRRPPAERQPRIFKSAESVAAYLDHSRGWMRDNCDRLYAAGFPKRDDLLDGWDMNAIDLWLDQRSGIVQPQDVDLIGAHREELNRDFGIG